MDPHLNLFYAYQKGDTDSLDGTKRLEDNLTRAFLVTLKSLKKECQYNFLSRLCDLSKSEKDLHFAIQGVSGKEDLSLIKKAGTKKILLIGGQVIDTDKFNCNLYNYKRPLEDFSALSDDKKKEAIAELGRNYKRLSLYDSSQESAFEFLGNQYSVSDISGMYDLLHECRPDGWVYTDNFAVLIESKIGRAQQSESQVFRHLSDSKGFGLKPDQIKKNWRSLHIFRSWEDVGTLLLEVDPESPIVRGFNDFLILIGEKMNLNFIVDSGYEETAMRAQFPKFLEALYDVTKNNEKTSKLMLANRPKANLWDYFGYPDKKSMAGSDPHYSVGFRENDTDISLTTKKTAQMKKFLKSDELLKYLLDVAHSDDEIKKQRMYLSIANYRLVDWKRGQIKGDSQETFVLRFLLSEIADKNNPSRTEENIVKLLDVMGNAAVFAKQLGFGLKVIYPKLKGSFTDQGLYEKNKELFVEEKRLVKLYSDFIVDTINLYELMRDGGK